uniref:Uncharacterized protein n=1 Tax=Anguilla anguilla TaxID=7936 RepID=A0A0E9Q298_ANGAN
MEIVGYEAVHMKTSHHIHLLQRYKRNYQNTNQGNPKRF